MVVGKEVKDCLGTNKGVCGEKSYSCGESKGLLENKMRDGENGEKGLN